MVYVTPEIHKVALEFIRTYAAYRTENNEQFLFSADTGDYCNTNNATNLVGI